MRKKQCIQVQLLEPPLGEGLRACTFFGPFGIPFFIWTIFWNLLFSLRPNFPTHKHPLSRYLGAQSIFFCLSLYHHLFLLIHLNLFSTRTKPHRPAACAAEVLLRGPPAPGHINPPPLSKARLGAQFFKKRRSDWGVRFGQGAPWTPFFLHFAYKPKMAVQKNGGPIGGCALDKGGPWAREGGISKRKLFWQSSFTAWWQV